MSYAWRQPPPQAQPAAYEFLDELPGDSYETRRSPRYRSNRIQDRSADLHAHAAALVANPMKWSPYPRPLATDRSANRTSDAIREGTFAAYHPHKGFQAASRQGTCYIRFNPAALDPRKEAFEAGLAEGRKRVMDEVGAVIWDLRQALAKIEGWENHRLKRPPNSTDHL